MYLGKLYQFEFKSKNLITLDKLNAIDDVLKLLKSLITFNSGKLIIMF